MTINLITIATVKAQLGITASTYDSALTALIPIVSADIRRILNTDFDDYEGGTFTAASTICTLECDTKLGTVIDSPYVAADTYVSSYDPISDKYTLSAAASTSGYYYYPTINISQWPTISKMIWYKYKAQNTSSANVKGISSHSVGPVSISYSESEINSKWNYPQKLIDDLGTPFAHAR